MYVVTGQELAAIREKLEMSAFDFGLALGYTGAQNTVEVAISRFEKGSRDIPPAIARLAEMYRRFGVPKNLRSSKQ